MAVAAALHALGPESKVQLAGVLHGSSVIVGWLFYLHFIAYLNPVRDTP